MKNPWQEPRLNHKKRSKESMEEIEALLKKEKPSKEDIDKLIQWLKSDSFLHSKNRTLPAHCGECSLFRFCKLINHKLICPWI